MSLTRAIARSLASPIAEGLTALRASFQAASVSVTALATGGTTAQLDISASPAGGTLYWYISTSATPPSASALRAGTGAVDSGSFVVLAIPTATDGPAGLTPSTNYWVHAVYGSGGDADIVTDAFTTEAADSAAPTLSSPSATVTGETTASGSVSTNEGRGVLYWVATVSATPPSAAQIRAGQDGAGSPAPADGSQAVSATGAQTIFGGVTGLTEGATYYLHFLQDDPTGNASNRVTTSGFVPADVTPPALSSADAEETGADTADASANTDTGEGTLYWVATTSATAPSAAQVLAGQDHTGAAAVADGSQVVTDDGPQSVAVTGLSGDTAYYLHFCHEDVAGNRSNVVTSPQFTTASATFYFVEWDDGVVGTVGSVNSTLTGAQADPDSGNNAILWSGDGLGSGSAELVTLTALCTYANAVSRIRCRLKVINKVAAKMWLRVQATSVTSADMTHIDITDDGTADGSRVGNTTVLTNVSCTAIGSGWFLLSMDYDPTGDPDLVGGLAFGMATVNNSSGIVNNTFGALQIAVYDLTMEQL